MTKVLKDNQLTFDGAYAINTIQPLLAPFSPGTAPAKRLLVNNTDPSQPGYLKNIGTVWMTLGSTGNGIPEDGTSP